MKLMTPKQVPGRKAAKPTQRPAKRRMPPVRGKKMPMKADPDMDGDMGAAETAVAEEKEPAVNYSALARKSGPTVI